MQLDKDKQMKERIDAYDSLEVAWLSAFEDNGRLNGRPTFYRQRLSC